MHVNPTDSPGAGETLDSAAATVASPESLKFSAVGLAPILQRAVADQGYTTMTPIQAKAIPLVLAGRDIMGAAQTGTGKTAAFSLPLLHKMLPHENGSMSPARHPVRALVIAPTRELADQVADNIKGYAAHSKLRCAVVFGGIDMKPQTLELKQGVEVLVATPGRLLDHIEAKNCVLNQVEYVVLDEADRMLDIGFLPDLQRILSYLPKQRQTLLFSATFSPEIRRLAESYLQDPLMVEVARPNATATNVEQRFYSVATDDKRRAVLQAAEGARDHAGAGVRQFQARLRPAGALVRARRPAHQRPARRQVAGRAAEGARRVQGRRGRRAGRHRRGRARPRHRRPAGGLQLRRAVQRRGLRAPDRPHRPRRRLGPGGHAGLARRRPAGRRHREADQEEDRDRAARTRRRRAAPRRSRARALATTTRTSGPPPKAACAVLGAQPGARDLVPPPPSRDPFFDKPYEASATRRRAGLGKARRAGRRAASRRTSSRRRRWPRCSAARSPSAETIAQAQRPASRAKTAGTSAGKARRPLPPAGDAVAAA